MNIIGWVLIAVIAVIAFLALIAVFRAGSRYFRSRWNYSIWPGFFMDALALAAVGMAVTQKFSWNVYLFIGAGVLVAGALILDILRTNAGMGIVAFLMQAVMAGGFVFVILAAVLILLLRNSLRGRGNVIRETAENTRSFSQTLLRLLAG